MSSSERSTARMIRNANGADIAVDPTLTDAWATLLANHPRSAWRPMSHHRTSRQILSPALAPASGSPFQRFQLFQAEALLCCTCLSVAPRPIIHIGLQVSSGWISGSRLLSIHQPSAECPALPVELRSRSSQATLLASGLNLLHARSQRPRGQFPPRRLF